MYKVYVKTDAQGHITAINSDLYIDNLEGWTEIDSGDSYKHQHAQANYLESLTDEEGCFKWELIDGKPQRRKEKDIQQEMAARPHFPTFVDRFKKLESVIALIKKLLGVND